VNSNDIALPAPSRIGQATAVEQSRAVAEVQAAIVVAQQCPRIGDVAVAAMRETCKQKALADRAFYRYPRADQTVTGASIHLARELVRCWGNVQYGVNEMRRDDDGGQSEMQAWAWDVQTNTRCSAVFIVPHKRDTKTGVKQLTDLRDVYENNANNGARRLRECIFSVLPAWFVEEAKALCMSALKEDTSDRPLAQRIADAVRVFGDRGVSADQMEQKLGRASGKWTEHDLAQLRVILASLDRGEVTISEEFPPKRVSVEELTAPAVETESEPPDPVDPPEASEDQADVRPIETRKPDWPEAAKPGSGGRKGES
jgi:hypothetical protein